MKVNSILETIGNTPHVKINRLFPDDYSVWVKLEKNNPGASIKDRIALSMIDDAEKKGLKPCTMCFSSNKTIDKTKNKTSTKGKVN